MPKALTICQPYADLICLPDDDDRAKRVENRTWATSYRGPLLIHAGKSKKWLAGDNYGIPLESMTFGAIVGAVRLSYCFRMEDLNESRAALRAHPWLAGHQHVEGPFCFVLTECRRFAEPIPYVGCMGLFDVPNEVVRAALEAIQ